MHIANLPYGTLLPLTFAMQAAQINYFTEDILFALPKKALITRWLQQLITQEKAVLGYLNVIFCSDQYLYAHNLQYLQHDTLTDVITFDYSETPGLIEGEVYISVPRVQENADTFQVLFLQELHRVMAHGVLHLLGYKDKTAHDKATMRAKEEKCLVAYEQMLVNSYQNASRKHALINHNMTTQK